MWCHTRLVVFRESSRSGLRFPVRDRARIQYWISGLDPGSRARFPGSGPGSGRVAKDKQGHPIRVNDSKIHWYWYWYFLFVHKARQINSNSHTSKARAKNLRVPKERGGSIHTAKPYTNTTICHQKQHHRRPLALSTVTGHHSQEHTNIQQSQINNPLGSCHNYVHIFMSAILITS